MSQTTIAELFEAYRAAKDDATRGALLARAARETTPPDYMEGMNPEFERFLAAVMILKIEAMVQETWPEGDNGCPSDLACHDCAIADTCEGEGDDNG